VAIEDLTTYTEVDPSADLTVTAPKVAFVNFDTRNTDTYVYKDQGVDFFDGDFIHDYEFKITAIDDSALPGMWMLANSVDDILGIKNASGDCYSSYILKPGVNPAYIFLREVDGGTFRNATGGTYVFTLNTDYYVRLTRDESIGSFGQLKQQIYSDAARTNLLHTQTLSLSTSKKDYRYNYALVSYNSSSPGLNAWGHVQNLDLSVTTFQAAWARNSNQMIGAGL